MDRVNDTKQNFNPDIPEKHPRINTSLKRKNLWSRLCNGHRQRWRYATILKTGFTLLDIQKM